MEPLLASELDSLDLFLLEKFLRVRKTIVTIDTREMEQAQDFYHLETVIHIITNHQMLGTNQLCQDINQPRQTTNQ